MLRSAFWRHASWSTSSRISYEFLRGLTRGAVEILYPPTCPVCQESLAEGAPSAGICLDCEVRLVDVRTACRRCGRPLADGIVPTPDSRCGGCRRKRLAFDQAIALGVYGAELRDVVLRMKRAGSDALGIAVGKLLAGRCRTLDPSDRIDLLVPVPIHWRRRFTRGGSCAELLAVGMSRELGIRAAPRLLRCRRNTKKQSTLLPTERRQNVRRAYRVSRGYDIKGTHVMLVDDVMTTGATASELARVLREFGASRVTLAVVARGIGFD